MVDEIKYAERQATMASMSCQQMAIIILAKHVVNTGVVSAEDLAASFDEKATRVDEAYSWDEAGQHLRTFAGLIRKEFGVKPPLKVV